MICEQCGKRPASFHITKIENGKKTDLHLCEQCAMQNNMINLSTPFSIPDLLSALLKNNVQPKKVEIVKEQKCNVCGMTFNRFKESGKFGCSNCYRVFGEKLDPVFKRLHGNTAHTGKIPKRSGNIIKNKREVDNLKRQLQTAIINEEYEQAAKLRDMIRELTQNKQGGEENELG